MNPNQPIYKVCSTAEWQVAVANRTFSGSAVDLRDGFIHFSAAHQVTETVRRHFQGQADLIVIAVDPRPLGADLRWEASRGGDLFPHLYGNLPVVAAVRAIPLQFDDAGEVVLP